MWEPFAYLHIDSPSILKSITWMAYDTPHTVLPVLPHQLFFRRALSFCQFIVLRIDMPPQNVQILIAKSDYRFAYQLAIRCCPSLHLIFLQSSWQHCCRQLQLAVSERISAQSRDRPSKSMPKCCSSCVDKKYF